MALQNELYAGRIIWNRQTFVKDPDTGKRISRANTPDKWMRADAEHLRIVDAKTWENVQARRGERAGTPLAARSKHLLSGLVKCGHCGSGYIVGGNDKRGSYLICSRMKETGLCDNKRTVARAAIEDHVLKGIETHLGAPEIVAEYVREYHRVSRELNSRAEGRRRDIDRRLGKINGAIKLVVDSCWRGA